NHLPVYLGLGRSDPMVPFADAESARDILLEAGYSVTLRGFEGGHVLPDAELRRAVDWLVEVDRNR
ncbi:MAG: carboxylesterase, partial [Gemmatimonadota bacterium]